MIALILLDFWWFAIPGLLLGLYAQARLSGTYNKYVRIGTATGVSGAQAARQILDRAGLREVDVHPIPGHLTDHYDPRKRALFLSGENFHGTSLAAVGVAAHEAGHALQHQAAYAPLKVRMALVPITQFASSAYIWIMLLGAVLGYFGPVLAIIIAIFTIIALFQVITLPVEFDASRRAKERLVQLGLVQPQESGAVSKVLNAAALTYVAAMVTAVFHLLHFIMLARNRN